MVFFKFVLGGVLGSIYTSYGYIIFYFIIDDVDNFILAVIYVSDVSPMTIYLC